MDAYYCRKMTRKYHKERVIGTGTFGTVYLVKINESSYALKEINMKKLTSIEKQRAFNEVSLLAKLSHKFIIKYKDSSLDHVSGKLLIVTDYAECGDLAKAILKQEGVPFSESKIIVWFLQITLALQYIHSQNILHRDLKTQNIFLCRDDTIKVGDFGIARVLEDSQDLATTGIGTPYYFSPEICRGKPYNSKSDIWALGCILFEMSSLTHPFRAESFPQLMFLILEGKRTPFPSWNSNLIKELVDKLLCYDPDERPLTEELLAYSSLQPYLSSLLQSMSTYPTKHPFKSPEESLKRSAPTATTSSSHSFKLPKFPKFSSKPTANELKPPSALTRVMPPAIVVTEYKAPYKVREKEPKITSAKSKLMENERKPRSASIQPISPAIVPEYKTGNKFMGNERKPRSESTRATPPAIVNDGKAENRFMENERKPRSESIQVVPSNAVVNHKTQNKITKTAMKSRYVFYRSTPPSVSELEAGKRARRNAVSISPPKKCENKVFTPKSSGANGKNITTTYTLFNPQKPEKIAMLSEEATALTPDIDCGYSSEEIICTTNTDEFSICEHSVTDGISEFSILKNNEPDESSMNQSHCQHSQCHQCMIDMMWKNRIRGFASVSKNNSDYLKLKKKLLLIFEPDLFKKVYESLLKEWEGSENKRSQASIRNYAKLLNYEQVQHLPLMMQLIQLDFLKLSADGTCLQSDELVML